MSLYSSIPREIEPQQLRYFQQWSLPHAFEPSGANHCKDRCQCGYHRTHEIHQTKEAQ
jgi:hypothetical protein